MTWQPKYNWYLVEILLFTLANFSLIYFIDISYEALTAVKPFTLFILGIATYRAANLISNEEITKVLRAPFVKEVKEDGKLVEEPKESGPKGAVGSLIYCSSCTGVWVACVIFYSYILIPTVTLIVALILTLSAVERFLTTTFDLLKGYTK